MDVETGGAVFRLRPRPGSRMTAADVNQVFAEQFPGTGLAITGPDGPAMLPDGTYEVRAFGPAGAEAVRMVARYCYWDIEREMA